MAAFPQTASATRRTRVMIIDDSPLVRKTLTEILTKDPALTVMGTAADPLIAAEMMKVEAPDVILLDIEMPRMDGLTFLRKLMGQHPLPVIICSTLAGEGSLTAIKALEYGAIEIIEKPKIQTRKHLEEASIFLCDKVKAARMARVGKLNNRPKLTPKLNADVILPRHVPDSLPETTEQVVAVGASTGGTEALQTFLTAMPMDCPGIVIVQHMPENFTAAFAKRMNTLCRIEVKESEDNDSIIRGRAIIARGNRHLLVKRAGARYFVGMQDGPPVSRHRPSVDVLFRSVARYVGPNAIGVIMTGMGDDGARGMKEMHEAGAFNIAQDENSCVVFGMPHEAIKLGGVHRIVRLSDIATTVINAQRH